MGFSHFCIFYVFLHLFIVDSVTVYGLFCVWILFVSTIASDCLEILVSEISYYMLSGT